MSGRLRRRQQLVARVDLLVITTIAVGRSGSVEERVVLSCEAEVCDRGWSLGIPDPGMDFCNGRPDVLQAGSDTPRFAGLSLLFGDRRGRVGQICPLYDRFRTVASFCAGRPKSGCRSHRVARAYLHSQRHSGKPEQLETGPAHESSDTSTLEARRLALFDRAERISGLGSWEWIPQLGELLWSDNLFRLFGYEPGSVTPSSDAVLDLVHVNDRERVADAMAALAAGTEMNHVDYRIVRTDGVVRHLRASLAILDESDPAGPRLFGSVQDVTLGASRRSQPRGVCIGFRRSGRVGRVPVGCGGAARRTGKRPGARVRCALGSPAGRVDVQGALAQGKRSVGRGRRGDGGLAAGPRLADAGPRVDRSSAGRGAASGRRLAPRAGGGDAGGRTRHRGCRPRRDGGRDARPSGVPVSRSRSSRAIS